MKLYDYSPPENIKKHIYYINAIKIIEKLNQRGFTAYIAGGFVRDLLIERKDLVFDIDIATDALPKEIQSLFKKTLEVGIQFGVIIVIYGKHHYEIATFRKDKNYLDGRRPMGITFSEPENDAKRRDFTINGLFFDPVNNRIIDYIEGYSDIQNKIIRAIGDPNERISEDKLRMLRAIRFSSILNFVIDYDTFKAISSRKEDITIVSRERVYDELKKALINNPKPSRFLILLEDSGLLEYIIPELLSIKDKSSILSMIDLNPIKNDMALIFAIILYELSAFDKKKIRNILMRLKFKRIYIKDIMDLIENKDFFFSIGDLNKSCVKRFFMKDNILKHLILLRLQIITSSKDIAIYYKVLNAFISFIKHPFPKPIINGKDLLSLNIKKGPLYSNIIRELYDLQLEKKINTKKQALEFINKKYILKSI